MAAGDGPAVQSVSGDVDRYEQMELISGYPKLEELNIVEHISTIVEPTDQYYHKDLVTSTMQGAL